MFIIFASSGSLPGRPGSNRPLERMFLCRCNHSARASAAFDELLEQCVEGFRLLQERRVRGAFEPHDTAPPE